MTRLETDYLVIGAGALAMGFVESILEHSDAHVTIIDRHAKPGGHWNVSYPFVTLHQPSATYGLNSVDLGDDRIDASGPNAGMYELATGTQVRDYFDRAMREKFLPTGRVSYHPMSDYCGNGAAKDGEAHGFASILDGTETTVTVRRKVVDGRAFTASVPATHTRKFEVADGVRITTPGKLPQVWVGQEGEDYAPPSRYVILGAGKTAMDVGVWLMQMGVSPDKIGWVRPRETWMINRLSTQPGTKHVAHTVDWQLAQMRAAKDATSADEIFLALEERGHMLRFDRDILPTKFVFPTISEGEVEQLRRIEDVIRIGRLSRIEPGKMIGQDGEAECPQDTLFVDCTASAASPRPPEPIWQEGRIVPQLLQVPLVSLSATIIGFIEAQYGTDAEKNAVAVPCTITATPGDYPAAMMGNAMNRMLWSQQKPIQDFLAKARLDPGTRIMAAMAGADDATKAAAMQIREATMAAVPNLQKLSLEQRARNEA
ncbi:uncharacterized protein HME9302_01988 [Alteripontixanthobacter maritimus]|uniref:NAD(P)/FAD-dependent oxidoreductase n=1 Tax=Alteripontixanthobacter maritimus TaxID=2161824 RepID=A0A369Q8G8_9SPHN|nr:hypothetical protein [Alteripontixanthobacter maritimus]RDC60772.1 uncharacterized protein HME9302_01988 [Alteripontixanthobacter maritimus]